MLSDHAFINVHGGSGGAGSVSFRREKHVPRGGPDGGNGGPGGDVVVVATRQFRDLSYFRHKVHFKGQRGGHGAGQKRHGKAGEPTIVEVPVGTEIRDREGVLVADLVAEGQRVVVAHGDEGGRGNTCFVSSTRRVPRFAEKGMPGEERWLDLQLKLLADIGLVGLPNAGKSSMLAALTRARPKVAAYPFTTLEPNLGTLELGERVVVIADIPGLIEGASSGTGLGDRFLAHVERTVVLVYVVDASLGADAALAAVTTVRGELHAFSEQLAAHPSMLALNKVDLLDDDEAAAVEAALTPVTREFAGPVVRVSAAESTGLKEFVRELDRLFSAQVAAALLAAQAAEPVAPPVVLRPGDDRVGDFTVRREDEGWRVTGRVIERLVAKADLGNDEAMRYLQEVMERAGLSTALRKAGGIDGDTVKIGDAEFELS
jgi:GTP-binding protein